MIHWRNSSCVWAISLCPVARSSGATRQSVCHLVFGVERAYSCRIQAHLLCSLCYFQKNPLFIFSPLRACLLKISPTFHLGNVVAVVFEWKRRVHDGEYSLSLPCGFTNLVIPSQHSLSSLIFINLLKPPPHLLWSPLITFKSSHLLANYSLLFPVGGSLLHLSITVPFFRCSSSACLCHPMVPVSRSLFQELDALTTFTIFPYKLFIMDYRRPKALSVFCALSQR